MKPRQRQDAFSHAFACLYGSSPGTLTRRAGRLLARRCGSFPSSSNGTSPRTSQEMPASLPLVDQFLVLDAASPMGRTAIPGGPGACAQSSSITQTHRWPWKQLYRPSEAAARRPLKSRSALLRSQLYIVCPDLAKPQSSYPSLGDLVDTGFLEEFARNLRTARTEVVLGVDLAVRVNLDYRAMLEATSIELHVRRRFPILNDCRVFCSYDGSATVWLVAYYAPVEAKPCIDPDAILEYAKDLTPVAMRFRILVLPIGLAEEIDSVHKLNPEQVVPYLRSLEDD